MEVQDCAAGSKKVQNPKCSCGACRGCRIRQSRQAQIDRPLGRGMLALRDDEYWKAENQSGLDLFYAEVQSRTRVSAAMRGSRRRKRMGCGPDF